MLISAESPRRRLSATVCAIALACAAAVSCSPEDAQSVAAASTTHPTFAAIAKGRVDVEGGTIRLAAQREGVIREVLVEEGAIVEKGQALAIIDSTAAEIGVRQAEADLAQTRAQLPVLEARLAAARREAERLRPLAAEHAVSQQDFDQANDQVRQILADIGVARAAVGAAQQRVAAQRYEIEARIVRAPLDGQIVRRSAKPGDGASTLNVTELFLLAPATARIVRAELDETFVDAVKPGQHVDVVIESSAGRTMKGKVLRIGQVFGVAKNRADDPSAPQDVRVVELVTSIEGGDALRIGQRVLLQVRK